MDAANKLQGKRQESIAVIAPMKNIKSNAQPRLSMDNDVIFFDDSKNFKAGGMDHLMERYFKYIVIDRLLYFY